MRLTKEVTIQRHYLSLVFILLNFYKSQLYLIKPQGFNFKVFKKDVITRHVKLTKVVKDFYVETKVYNLKELYDSNVYFHKGGFARFVLSMKLYSILYKRLEIKATEIKKLKGEKYLLKLNWRFSSGKISIFFQVFPAREKSNIMANGSSRNVIDINLNDV